VGSALDQPGVDVRVLVIDDASPDDSAEVARQLATADSRVEVWAHEQNAGHIATYNEGLLDWCRADYTVLLSADDQLTPGALRRAAALLDAHPHVGLVYGHYLNFTSAGSLPPARTRVTGWTVWSGHDWLRRRFREGNGCITSPEVVVRTSLQQKLGGYDPALPHTGDIEMWMRFAVHSDIGYLRGVDQAYYRSHGQNMSIGFAGDGGLADLRQRLAAYEAILREHGHLIPEAHVLEHSMRRALAREALWKAARAYDRGRVRSVNVDAFVGFAESTYPQARRLPGWTGLRVRRSIGEAAMPYLQPFVLTAPIRKARNRLWWESWKRRGI
jgi:hypothetical protein